MDEFLQSRFRAVGAVTVLVLAIFFIVLLFVQYREKKDTAIKLKIFYSDIVQALLISKNYNSVAGEWGLKPGYKNVEILNNNLFHYLKVKENCAQKPGTCMPDTKYKSIKEKQTNINLYNFPSVSLQNGISIAVETIGKCKKSNEPCAIIYTDLNGPEEPNAFGKDLFVFLMINHQSVAVLPYNNSLSTDELRNNAKFGCNENADVAMNCCALIARKGWRIDKKYPW